MEYQNTKFDISETSASNSWALEATFCEAICLNSQAQHGRGCARVFTVTDLPGGAEEELDDGDDDNDEIEDIPSVGEVTTSPVAI